MDDCPSFIISLTAVRCVQLGISHTQWTIVHHFSHSCEMRAVGVRDFHVSLFNHQLMGDNSGPEVVVMWSVMRLSHMQWTIVHPFSHSCEMRAVGDLSHAVDDSSVDDGRQ